jgi:hypothetical protein
VHNHNVNEAIYGMYKNSAALISDDMLLGKQLEAMIQVKAPTRNMANFVGHAVGHHVETQQIRNIISSQLGGPTAELRMKKLVADFLEAEGNNAAFMEDGEEGMTSGLVMQSKAQAAVFDKWPEVMILDWTYTNNIGFNLGTYSIYIQRNIKQHLTLLTNSVFPQAH